MSLSNKSILAIIEDPTLMSKVESTLKPSIKSFVGVSGSSEGIKKMDMQKFDVFILRTTKPSLMDPKKIFVAAQAQKAHKNVPWIVLGKDVEDESIVISHNHVKFTPDAGDIDGVMKILTGLSFAPPAGPSAGATLDVNFINPLVKAVVGVVQTMAQIDLEREAPFIKKPTDAPTKSDISGIIAMNSDRFLGSMALCFEKNLALGIYSKMFGSTVGEINDDVKDSVSEMTNIIFGNAKRDLNVDGHTIAPAIPSVVVGPGHAIHHSVQGYCFCIPFKSPYGRVVVECVINMKTA